MPARTAFRISLAAGLLVLAVTLLSATQEPVRPCGNLPQNYAPIIAFELARSAQDLEAIFGTEPSCRAAMVERMDAINLVDVLVYIPAYCVFMACFFLGMRVRHAAWGLLGFRVAIVAALADFAENACLMSLTPDVNPSSAWFALLPWATGVKWLGLGAAAGIAAMLYLRAPRSSVWLWLAALLCTTAFLSTVAAIADPARFGATLGLGVGLSWLTYLITAGGGAVRGTAPASGTGPVGMS
ncbi:MAG TPA: hypothetical protein VJQ52_20640 [Steroidobacteraceae bacterium]|nr:hypothetical protein [Steroidobacteraceae bacterium]